MAILSMKARNKMSSWLMSGLVVWTAVTLQVALLNRFPIGGAFCNLPLALVICWGAVFGSPLPPIRPEELRRRSLGDVFSRQLLSGSLSGLLVGGLISAIYMSQLPVFSLSYPIVGWLSGYLCLRNINKENLLCIPLVLLFTGLGELIMATQLNVMTMLHMVDRANVYQNMAQVLPPEAFTNAVIAPFIYYPLRRWYELYLVKNVPAAREI